MTKPKIFFTTAFFLLLLPFSVSAGSLLVEAESFGTKGGWIVDQQFMDLMGSPYLLAHGMGKPTADASTEVVFPKKGKYHIYVRTFNWTSPWSDGEGPGKFVVEVNGAQSSPVGHTGREWEWQYAGRVNVKDVNAVIALKDLAGFDGRCDAIYFTSDRKDIPPASGEMLAQFKRSKLNMPAVPDDGGEYDLVVVGGGVAGMCAAVSAARLGCKVALVNDRPVLGGANSSEIRVHLGGRIGVGPYPELGNMIKEFGPSRRGNAMPAEYYEDDRKQQFIEAEENVALFPCYRVIAVETDRGRIVSVTAQHIETGREMRFRAPLFADCTGDGTIGFLAGADFAMGREAQSEYSEETAPPTADKMTMGSSVQWYSRKADGETSFPVFEYGMNFSDESVEKVTMGEWTWETGMNRDQIYDFEYIRDYGLLVVYSNWSYLKNRLADNGEFRDRELDWVACIAGKRESRRLLGDYVLSEGDIVNEIAHEDATASATWSIDLHYPDPKNTKYFPDNEFKSIARHIPIHAYPIPYRCLYSRNVDNLFMAGRNISVTHVALGTTRVMRTTGMMGEVVGMAAYLCNKHGVLPRGVYCGHLPELKELMKEGAGKKDLPDNQQYNLGRRLPPRQQ